MYLLLETSIPKLKSGGFVSNLTQGYLDDRMKKQYEISVSSSLYNISKDFLEVIFSVISTESERRYTVILRFYDVGRFIKDDLATAKFSIVEKTLNKIIKLCDVRFYSDDPSFLWQGCWEGLDNHDMSIFKFNDIKGKGIWDDRHMRSGGIQNKEVHLTKHLAQIVNTIGAYVSEISQKLKVSN